MKLRRSASPHPVLLFLAPALQLSLAIIFFLLIGSSVLIQPGVAVNVPTSPFVVSPLRNPRIISITAPPLSAIFYENQEVDLAELRARLQKARGRTQTIVIKADRRALYENITSVMNVAVELGFPVVLATSEESGDL